VASNRPFATSRSSGRTSVFRQAPLAAWKVILAAATMTDTTRSWAKLSQPSANAAGMLSVSQQAVSKRIAGLERDLGVRLFTRTARGAELTADGQAFLPHARQLLRAEERAAASVRPGRRDAGTWAPSWAATAATAATAVTAATTVTARR